MLFSFIHDHRGFETKLQLYSQSADFSFLFEAANRPHQVLLLSLTSCSLPSFSFLAGLLFFLILCEIKFTVNVLHLKFITNVRSQDTGVLLFIYSSSR